MYKVIITDLILALIIGLIYIVFNGFTVNAFYVITSFFIVLLLRDYIMYIFKKRKHD